MTREAESTGEFDGIAKKGLVRTHHTTKTTNQPITALNKGKCRRGQGGRNFTACNLHRLRYRCINNECSVNEQRTRGWTQRRIYHQQLQKGIFRRSKRSGNFCDGQARAIHGKQTIYHYRTIRERLMALNG